MAEKRFKLGVENLDKVTHALREKDITPTTTWAEYQKELGKKRKPVMDFMAFVIAKAEARNKAEIDEEKKLDLTVIPKVSREGMAEFSDEAGREAFRRVVNEAIDILVTHGRVEILPDGSRHLKTFSDLDGKACLYLCKLAGIKVKPTPVEPGEFIEGAMNMDTSGRQGVEFDPETATLYIDHHSEFSPSGTSSAKYLYEEVLWRAGLVKPTMSLEGAIEFVTAMDNGDFQREYDLTDYFLSGSTLVGLANYLSFPEIVAFFKSLHNDPTMPLSDKDLAKWHRGKGTSLQERAEKRQEILETSFEEVIRMQSEGYSFESPTLGAVLVDIGNRAPFGREAAMSIGFDAYVIWNPKEESFVIQSKKDLGIKLDQGFVVRSKMWLKPRGGEKLTVSLKDILSELTGGDLVVKGGLAEYLEEEAEAGVEAEEPLNDGMKEFFEGMALGEREEGEVMTPEEELPPEPKREDGDEAWKHIEDLREKMRIKDEQEARKRGEEVAAEEEMRRDNKKFRKPWHFLSLGHWKRNAKKTQG